MGLTQNDGYIWSYGGSPAKDPTGDTYLYPHTQVDAQVSYWIPRGRGLQAFLSYVTSKIPVVRRRTYERRVVSAPKIRGKAGAPGRITIVRADSHADSPVPIRYGDQLELSRADHSPIISCFILQNHGPSSFAIPVRNHAGKPAGAPRRCSPSVWNKKYKNQLFDLNCRGSDRLEECMTTTIPHQEPTPERFTPLTPMSRPRP